MNNWNKVLEAQTIATNSSGLALQRYQTYLGGLEATTNRFTVAWEKLASNTINSDFIKFLLVAGTEILKVADAIGILNIAFVALAITMGYKNLGIGGLITNFGTLINYVIAFVQVLGSAITTGT